MICTEVSGVMPNPRVCFGMLTTQQTTLYLRQTPCDFIIVILYLGLVLSLQ